MISHLPLLSAGTCLAFLWGFYAHQMINQLAVFTLPPEMIAYYKVNIEYIRAAAVDPDRRRYSIPEEAPRHYIDLDHYGDSAIVELPRSWLQAVGKMTEDTLQAYGIVPWHINRMYWSLREAFLLRDPARILKLSAELGHYVGDAHVPLHTTENYNGQLTGQDGIHGFWESRLPEMFAANYNFLVGRAEYLEDPQAAAWEAVIGSHLAVDSVLHEERLLAASTRHDKFSFETKGRTTVKVYAAGYSTAYHRLMNGMVERRMKAAIRMTGSLWYTAWVDAGQPDLKTLLTAPPSPQEIANRKAELSEWRQEMSHSKGKTRYLGMDRDEINSAGESGIVTPDSLHVPFNY